MGHRANFVLIRDGVARAYEDQWAALGCTYQFVDGPEAATLAAEELTPTGELMDWAFAEAGYLIDHDRRIAIVFGYPEPFGDDFGLDEEELDEFGIELDKVEGQPELLKKIDEAFEEGPIEFLKTIAHDWQGWELRWDERGVDAFAIYLEERDIKGIKTAPLSSNVTESPVVLAL